jgi:hypothetical protein
MKRHMTKNVKIKCAAIVGTAALLGGTAFVASGSTGAYFSDTHTGAITGTIGSIRITPSGGTASNDADGSLMDLAFNDLLPGTPQTVTVNYQNTGNSPEDVYIVFPNATALSALNSLGNYGTVHLSSVGSGAVGDVFDSQNLNDNGTSCPLGTTSVAHPYPCEPLPTQLLIASNVGPSAGGAFSFNFQYASALSTQAPAGTTADWNSYPALGQTTTNPGDGSGNGLPYEIVATQHGITPGAAGTKP